jgi:hypothetical protein
VDVLQPRRRRLVYFSPDLDFYVPSDYTGFDPPEAWDGDEDEYPYVPPGAMEVEVLPTVDPPVAPPADPPAVPPALEDE